MRTAFVDPVWLTLGLWTFVVLGSTTAGLNPVEPLFLAFLLLGVGAHLAGMLARRIVHSGLRRRTARRPPEVPDKRIARARQRRAKSATWLLATVLILGLAYFVAAYAEVVPALDASGFLAARNAYLEEVRGLRAKQFLYTTHLTLLGLGAMFFAALSYRRAVDAGLKASRHPANVLALVTFSIAILTTGRTAPLLVLLSYAFFCLRFGLYAKRNIIGAFVLLSLSMFIIVALALGKEGLGDSSSIDASEALMNLGRVYFFSAPVALQEVVLRGEVVSNACSNVFSYPIDLLKKLGLFAQCDVRELDFVFVPVATNVYTFLRAYWEDFGLAYPLALFCVGYLIEWVYERAFIAQGFAAFVYPFVLNAALLQIFEEQLFANGSVFSYLVLSYLLCGVAFGQSVRRRRHIGAVRKPSSGAWPLATTGGHAAP